MKIVEKIAQCKDKVLGCSGVDFVSLLPPEGDNVYINCKGTVVMNVEMLAEIVEDAKTREKIIEVLNQYQQDKEE